MLFDYIETIFDIETQTSVTVPYTREQIELAKQDQVLMQEKVAILNEERIALNSVKDKLQALGLTAEEITALIK